MCSSDLTGSASPFRAYGNNGNGIILNPSYNYYDAYNHVFRTLNGSSTSLTIDNTGAATFSTGTVFSSNASLINTDASILNYTNSYMYIQGVAAGGLWLAGGSTRNNNIAIREAANKISFYTSGNENMVILNNGRVGIGTTNPPDKFVVSNGGAEGIEFGIEIGRAHV